MNFNELSNLFFRSPIRLIEAELDGGVDIHPTQPGEGGADPQPGAG